MHAQQLAEENFSARMIFISQITLVCVVVGFLSFVYSYVEIILRLRALQGSVTGQQRRIRACLRRLEARERAVAARERQIAALTEQLR